MKNYIIVGLVLVTLIGVVLLFRSQTTKPTTHPPQSLIPTPTSAIVDPASVKTEIQASFKIITDNITRSFTNPKYHNKSADVFIEASDPTVVHVKKSGITWADFFNTLPMKLSKTCLTTGDGETFCNGKGGTLKFYLNDVEDKDLLEKQIHEGDSALIQFTSN